MEVRIDEATPTIAPQHSAVIAVLARQSAIKAVKEQLRRQGLKPAHIAKREIVAIAVTLCRRRSAFAGHKRDRDTVSGTFKAGPIVRTGRTTYPIRRQPIFGLPAQ
jgi:hypothetical protein